MDVAEGKMRCLSALDDWDQVYQLTEESWPRDIQLITEDEV